MARTAPMQALQSQMRRLPRRAFLCLSRERKRWPGGITIFMSLTTHLLIVFNLSLCPLLVEQGNAQQRNFPQPPPPRDATVTAIPGVVDAGAKWTLVWQGNENA